jgi:NadR type nicotinamide-nucleotide adenylyltransferase
VSARLPTVVVTGSECTGKSTLAAELAERFGTVASAEFSREYLDRKGHDLDASDIEPIARGQLRTEDEAATRASGVIVKDTDLVSTVVYARHYYGSCPPWIERTARVRIGDLYLLLHPDVPWVGDGLQRDREQQRDHMHRLFRERLEAWNATVVDVEGDWEARRATAFAAVERLLVRERRT